MNMTILGLIALCTIWAVYKAEQIKLNSEHSEDIERLISNHNVAMQYEILCNDHFRLIVPAQITMLNERAEEIRHLKSQLANRKGQITVLKRKLNPPEDPKIKQVDDLIPLGNDGCIIHAVKKHRELFGSSLGDAFEYCRGRRAGLRIKAVGK